MAFLATVLTATVLTHAAARAETHCKDVPGIGPEIAKFFDEVAAAHGAGQGTLPFMDVLFGVTGIDADDLAVLDQRAPVQVTKQAADGGAYSSSGAKKVTVEGIFADETTFFRIPKLVAGRYTLTLDTVTPDGQKTEGQTPDGLKVDGQKIDGVTLNYDPAHSVELGARVMGMRFFKPIHHTVITRQGLSFFLDENAGPDPDRCYRAVAG